MSTSGPAPEPLGLDKNIKNLDKGVEKMFDHLPPYTQRTVLRRELTINQLEEVSYTAKTDTADGRNEASCIGDGRLSVTLTPTRSGFLFTLTVTSAFGLIPLPAALSYAQAVPGAEASVISPHPEKLL
jgi:hypothetical protein